MILQRIKLFIDAKGLTIASFERSVGMSNASFAKALKNDAALGSDKLENILRVYPELSPTWLLIGEGEMLRNVTQTSSGNNSPNISGNGNNINNSSTIDKAINEISEHRKLIGKSQDHVSKSQEQISKSQEQLSKSQEQIDRLLTLLENKYKAE